MNNTEIHNESNLLFFELFNELATAYANFESPESGISYLINVIGLKHDNKEEVMNTFCRLIDIIGPELATLFRIFMLVSETVPSSGLIHDLSELEKSANEKIKNDRWDLLEMDEIIFIGAKMFYLKLFDCEKKYSEEIDDMTNLLIEKILNKESTENKCEQCKFHNQNKKFICEMCKNYSKMRPVQNTTKQRLMRGIKKS